MSWYVLDDDGVPRQVPWEEGARAFEDAERRTVAREELQIDGENVLVSTVFLGVDHNFGTGRPVLFETMVFGGRWDDWQWRYETIEHARTGHDRVVADLRAGTKPDSAG